MPTDTIPADWRAHGAKRYGKRGWNLTERRRRWMLTAGFVERGTESSFWRVGICEPYDGALEWTEVAHVRCETEQEALDAFLWLAAAYLGGTEPTEGAEQ